MNPVSEKDGLSEDIESPSDSLTLLEKQANIEEEAGKKPIDQELTLKRAAFSIFMFTISASLFVSTYTHETNERRLWWDKIQKFGSEEWGVNGAGTQKLKLFREFLDSRRFVAYEAVGLFVWIPLSLAYYCVKFWRQRKMSPTYKTNRRTWKILMCSWILMLLLNSFSVVVSGVNLVQLWGDMSAVDRMLKWATEVNYV